MQLEFRPVFFFQSLPTMRQKSEKDLLVARNEIAHSFDSHFMNIHAIRNIPFVVFIIIGEVYFEFRIWPPSEPELFMKGMKSGKSAILNCGTYAFLSYSYGNLRKSVQR